MAQQIAEGTRYTVQPGDSLFEIAQQAYGDGNLWPKIYEVNKQTIGGNPNLLRPGEVLYIPILPNTEYTVQPGDSLFGIAQQACGDGNLWPRIYEANRQTIGDNPNFLQPGEVLYIPECY